MRIRLLSVIIAISGGGCGEPAPHGRYGPVGIEGDRAFVRQVRRALRLLDAEIPDGFELVAEHIGTIRQADRSGMLAYSDPPVMELSDRSAHYSVTWCAGGIVHEAHHSMVYRTYRDAHGLPVPDGVWTGEQAECAAIERQLEVLAALGAPAHEREHVARQDGRHHDVNGDGTYDWTDCRLRDW